MLLIPLFSASPLSRMGVRDHERIAYWDQGMERMRTLTINIKACDESEGFEAPLAKLVHLVADLVGNSQDSGQGSSAEWGQEWEFCMTPLPEQGVSPDTEAPSSDDGDYSIHEAWEIAMAKKQAADDMLREARVMQTRVVLQARSMGLGQENTAHLLGYRPARAGGQAKGALTT